MCLILVAWKIHPDYPLVVAANRDEFFARRSAGADFWREHPQVLAGRDLEAGGSWLGMTRTGRFAALTNYRDPTRQRPDAISRGKLVADFLVGDAGIDAYLDAIDPAAYNGFNLLLGDGRHLIATSSVAGQRHELSAGVYGLSNALLDTPWPKVGAGKTALVSALTALPDETALWRLLRDDTIHPDAALPATGVSLDWERLLSAAFIRGADYGTRCSTVIKIGVSGAHESTASFDEQSWLPMGLTGERRLFRFRLESG
jgi:uncharacterized protein with NRDE domain